MADKTPDETPDPIILFCDMPDGWRFVWNEVVQLAEATGVFALGYLRPSPTEPGALEFSFHTRNVPRTSEDVETVIRLYKRGLDDFLAKWKAGAN